MEIPRGRGVLKAKILEAKYEAKLEFPGRIRMGDAKQKTFHGGGSMDIFWNCIIFIRSNDYIQFTPLETTSFGLLIFARYGGLGVRECTTKKKGFKRSHPQNKESDDLITELCK